MSTLIIVGSARRDGDTARAAELLRGRFGASVVHLLDYTIAPYDYAHAYPRDDQFEELIDVLLTYERVVLASPVYWYSMSGRMKTFLDRFSDLLQISKGKGRQLRGKELGVLSCSPFEVANAGFYEAFRLTAGYLGMEYGREYHGWVTDGGSVQLV
jgi:multimeric flavodoxin WrbA